MLKESGVNGPGERLVIWTQGCGKACPGCFNPETWKFSSKWMENCQTLAEHVISSNPEGLTLTGGDPLEQPEALLSFLKALHRDGSPESLAADFLPKGIICFTGYVLEELTGAALECVEYFDLLIDGRYVEQLRYTSGLAGSSNQRFHFSSHPGRGEARLDKEAILIDQAIEIHVDDIDSSIIRVTGFPTIDRAFLKKHGLSVELTPESKVN
jgi:anaerobic ribonucleoside-triphosphate reductase activating protein